MEHGDAQDRLIALVRSLQEHDIGTLDEKKLWKDLPRLGWSLRESFELYDNVSKPDEYVNICKMYALCAHEQIADTLPYAVIVFRTVLEKEQVPDGLDVRLRALIKWVQIAGKEIYNGGEAKLESSPLCRGGDLWKGTAGLSKARWNFWKERAQSLSSDLCEPLIHAMTDAESA